jgi:putative endonuclease
MFTVYVLRSKSRGSFYTGSTSDLAKRLIRHNANLNRSTKNRGPWELVHTEAFATLAEAVRRERELKTGKGRDSLRKMLKLNP